MQRILDIIIKLKEIIFTIVTLFILGLGTWLSFKLIPINQSINSLEFRVKANENSVGEIKQDLKDIKIDVSEVKTDVSFIRGVIEGNK